MPGGLDLLLSLSPPDFEVCEVVSSSEELEELSESELSDSELLESILLIFFLTCCPLVLTESSAFLAGGSAGGFPGAFFTCIMLTGGALAWESLESEAVTEAVPFTLVVLELRAGLVLLMGPGLCLMAILLVLGAGEELGWLAELSDTGLPDFLPGLTLGSTIPSSFSITILDLAPELELCI